MRVVAGIVVLSLAALAVACGSGGARAGDGTAAAPTHRALPSAAVTATETAASAASPAAVVSPEPAVTAASQPTPPAQPTSAPPRPVATSTPAPPPPPSPPPPPPPPAAQSLTVTARNLAFDPRSIAAKAGSPLTITLSNQDIGVRHDITIYSPGGTVIAKTDIIDGPVSASTTFTPSAGTYPFKCSVHFSMTGSLVVQ